MENKLFWVPHLVHRDEDKQKCHIIGGLETENGDSIEWKIHLPLHLPHTVHRSLATLYTKRRGENCNHMRPHKHKEQKICSRCTSSSPVDLLQVRDAHKSQRTTSPFKNSISGCDPNKISNILITRNLLKVKWL